MTRSIEQQSSLSEIDITNGSLPGFEETPEASLSAKKILIRRPEMVKNKIPWYDIRGIKIWRHSIQAVFVLINIYIGATFYFWVRHYETLGETAKIARPGGVEAWLPIAGLLNLKYLVVTGKMPYIHAAAMLLLIAFFLVSLLLKKSFCAWVCPLGTLSEALWQGGKWVLGKNWLLPKWADIPLRLLKYLLLSFFIWILASLPAIAVEGFMNSPYSVVSDVRMMNFFRFAGTATIVTVVLLIVGSIFIPNLWCRYLCPYGALIGLLSVLSPVKIRRDPDACIDCAKCARVCPARLPVDIKNQMISPECTACMHCIDICPAKDALQFSLPPRKLAATNGDEAGIHARWHKRKLNGAMVTLSLILIIGGMIFMAKITGYWENPFPEEKYQQLIPRAHKIGHF